MNTLRRKAHFIASSTAHLQLNTLVEESERHTAKVKTTPAAGVERSMQI